MSSKIKTAIIIILLIPVFVLSSYAASVPKAVLNSQNSVVRIYAECKDYISSGSGFAIKSNSNETLIATNYHVVEGNPSSIKVWVYNEPINSTILCYSEQRDLCILKLDMPVKMKALPLYTKTVNQGVEVFAVGFPAAADYLSDTEAHTSDEATITNGIVSAIRQATIIESGKAVTLLQINADINSGNSGGPLFDSKGYVLGVNTYGANDSIGINGAISATELYDFASTNQIKLSSNISASTVVVCIAVCLLAIIASILGIKKISMISRSKDTTPENLQEYLNNGEITLSPEQAVSLLMPIAIKLRDFHNEGRLHLELSPSTIFISNNVASLYDPQKKESNRYISGFAAPETYSGKQISFSSDIYSFCALLYYVSQGVSPENALRRTTDSIDFQVDEIDENFKTLILKGLSINADNRFDSFQNLISQLAPYNTGETIPEKENKSESKTAKKPSPSIKEIIHNFFSRKRIIPLWVYPIAAFAVFVLTYFGMYFQAEKKAENGDFLKADKLLFAKSITQLHNSTLVKYVNAGVLFEDKNYSNAYDSFYELQGYLNSNNMANTSLSLQAEQYINQGEYEKAANIYASLKKEGFEEASRLYYEANCLLAEKCISENYFQEALQIYDSLNKEGYKDAYSKYKETQIAQAEHYLDSKCVTESLQVLELRLKLIDKDAINFVRTNVKRYYDFAVSQYRKKAFSDSEYVFNSIIKYNGDYLLTNDYLTLLSYHSYTNLLFPYYDKLFDLCGFEDANALILSSNATAIPFIRGSWSSSAGSYFKIDKDNYYSTSLPVYDGSYHFDNGVFYTTYNKNEKASLRFKIITKDIIEIYCFKTHNTYSLHRN